MTIKLINADCREALRAMAPDSVQCVVTSPPYFQLRDYDVEGQMGLEETPEEFVAAMVDVFREVKRVLRPDGIMWLNMGDSYAGSRRGGDTNQTSGLKGGWETQDQSMPARKKVQSRRRDDHEIPRSDFSFVGYKPKDLLGMPWMLAFALRADGWWLRQDIIWHKPNPMPESAEDRCTKAHEYLFLLSKSQRYFFDQDAILEQASASTHARLAQDVQAQIGSDRANGGTRADRPMKAMGRSPPPQGWHSSDGFHGQDLSRDRAAQAAKRMGGGNRTHKGEQAYEDGRLEHRTKKVLVDYSRKMAAAGEGIKNNTSMDAALAIMPQRRNKRSVWSISTVGFTGEFCVGCKTYFEGETLRALKTTRAKDGDREIKRRWCSCGRHDAWLSHFATFPSALVEPCIGAGTSAHGACATCGAPWERIRDVSYENPGNRTTNGPRSTDRKHLEHGSAGYEQRMEKVSTTTGWQPTCGCEGAGVRPCVVLDPFGGAGTTGLVADRMQRDVILIELNEDYAEIIRQRLVAESPLFATVTG